MTRQIDNRSNNKESSVNVTHFYILNEISLKESMRRRQWKNSRHPICTSSFKLDDDIETPDPQENCTSILSPNRLARKNIEFPIVVIP
jgi:hypothetical protein